ncbi:hypothetical protein BDR07DRAFT_583808 [Suillus spraguei]|nr:hypothetical protein BDR07DRAFT_583808 [Suillus spraguei]
MYWHHCTTLNAYLQHAPSISSLYHAAIGFMSSVPPTTPFIRPKWVAICQSCSEPAEWQVCKDNSKGNQGRWYAVC